MINLKIKMNQLKKKKKKFQVFFLLNNLTNLMLSDASIPIP